MEGWKMNFLVGWPSPSSTEAWNSKLGTFGYQFSTPTAENWVGTQDMTEKVEELVGVGDVVLLEHFCVFFLTPNCGLRMFSLFFFFTCENDSPKGQWWVFQLVRWFSVEKPTVGDTWNFSVRQWLAVLCGDDVAEWCPWVKSMMMLRSC